MITVQEEIQKTVKRYRKEARELVKMQKHLETHCPEILDMSAPRIIVTSSELLHFDDPTLLNKSLGVAILRISGAEKLTFSHGYDNAGVSIGGKWFTLALQRGQKPCKKVRVTETKVIEICGKLNESDYDKVEYLD